MPVYKILRENEWHAIQEEGRLAGSADDLRDGYIHLSTAEQVPQTLERHFFGDAGLWLLEIEEAVLGPDLRWEPSNGETYPHLYRALELSEISRAEQIHQDRDLPFGI